MRISTSAETINCCAIIRAIVPSESEKINQLIESLVASLEIQPMDAVNLFKRALSPSAPPVFDGQHELAEWYDNNIQMPRLLLAICQHFNYPQELPLSVSEQFDQFDANETLKRASDRFNQYVVTQRQLLGMR